MRRTAILASVVSLVVAALDTEARPNAVALAAPARAMSSLVATQAGAGGTIDAIFGGAPYTISQEFGYTGFEPAPGAYDYAAAYGLQSGDHAGVDFSVPRDTPLHAAFDAEVVTVGGTPFFRDDLNPAAGELRFRLADGIEVIYGHTSQVEVALGDLVAPGQRVGLSGSAGVVGPVLHLEVLVPDPTTPSGQRVVDPLQFFGTVPVAAATPAAADAELAAAIDVRIAESNAANARTSPLTGMGAAFVELGTRYGINPAVVAAVLQRESQLGADGSVLSTMAYNFGGIAGIGNCGLLRVVDRFFAKFCTVDGLDASFAVFDQPIYRQTDGTLGAIMAIYAPPEEHDWPAMWATFQVVGEQLGIPLDRDTQVYTTA